MEEKDKIMKEIICELMCKMTFGKICLGWRDKKCCG